MSQGNGTVMLELDKVSLSYPARRGAFDHGSHHVLDSVSLKVYEGEGHGWRRRVRSGRIVALPCTSASR